MKKEVNRDLEGINSLWGQLFANQGENAIEEDTDYLEKQVFFIRDEEMRAAMPIEVFKKLGQIHQEKAEEYDDQYYIPDNLSGYEKLMYELWTELNPDNHIGSLRGEISGQENLAYILGYKDTNEYDDLFTSINNDHRTGYLSSSDLITEDVRYFVYRYLTTPQLDDLIGPKNLYYEGDKRVGSWPKAERRILYPSDVRLDINTLGEDPTRIIYLHNSESDLIYGDALSLVIDHLSNEAKKHLILGQLNKAALGLSFDQLLGIERAKRGRSGGVNIVKKYLFSGMDDLAMLPDGSDAIKKVRFLNRQEFLELSYEEKKHLYQYISMSHFGDMCYQRDGDVYIQLERLLNENVAQIGELDLSLVNSLFFHNHMTQTRLLDVNLNEVNEHATKDFLKNVRGNAWRLSGRQVGDLLARDLGYTIHGLWDVADDASQNRHLAALASDGLNGVRDAIKLSPHRVEFVLSAARLQSGQTSELLQAGTIVANDIPFVDLRLLIEDDIEQVKDKEALKSTYMRKLPENQMHPDYVYYEHMTSRQAESWYNDFGHLSKNTNKIADMPVEVRVGLLKAHNEIEFDRMDVVALGDYLAIVPGGDGNPTNEIDQFDGLPRRYLQSIRDANWLRREEVMANRLEGNHLSRDLPYRAFDHSLQAWLGGEIINLPIEEVKRRAQEMTVAELIQAMDTIRGEITNLIPGFELLLNRKAQEEGVLIIPRIPSQIVSEEFLIEAFDAGLLKSPIIQQLPEEVLSHLGTDEIISMVDANRKTFLSWNQVSFLGVNLAMGDNAELLNYNLMTEEDIDTYVRIATGFVANYASYARHIKDMPTIVAHKLLSRYGNNSFLDYDADILSIDQVNTVASNYYRNTGSEEIVDIFMKLDDRGFGLYSKKYLGSLKREFLSEGRNRIAHPFTWFSLTTGTHSNL